VSERYAAGVDVLDVDVVQAIAEDVPQLDTRVAARVDQVVTSEATQIHDGAHAIELVAQRLRRIVEPDVAGVAQRLDENPPATAAATLPWSLA